MLIRRLEFVLENCESIVIDGKYIGAFHLGDIKREISRLGCNHIGDMNVCNRFYVELHKDANKKHAPFGDEENATTVFKRLTAYNDITQINIRLYDQYSDDKDDETKDVVEHFVLHWEGESNYENAVQYSKISQTGWMYLAVGKETNLEEMFPSDEVDDEDYADLHASMMDIGDKYWNAHQELMNTCKNQDQDEE